MLKLYKLGGMTYQFEEGKQPEGAELVKPGEPYELKKDEPVAEPEPVEEPEPKPEAKKKPAKNKAKKAANKKG